MKLPSKNRTVAAPVAEAVAPTAPVQAAPTGTGKYTGVLTRIIRERIALLEMTGRDEELSLAREAATERGCTLDVALDDRHAELFGRRESALFAQSALRATRRDQMRAAQPHIRAAVEERFQLEHTILSLGKRIASFDSARRDFAERMARTGLTTEEISRIALKPTHDELAVWRDQLAAAQARVAEITARLKNGAAAFLPEAA